MVGTVAGVKARRFERRMSKEQSEAPASQGPLSSLLAACSVTLCRTGPADAKDPEITTLLGSRSRDRAEVLRIEQRVAESNHLRTLVNANPLPEGGRGRRPSRSSDMSDKSVISDD